MTLPASGQKWLDTLESMRATIAELAAERDRYRDALLARHGGEPLSLLSELDAARAERDAAVAKCAELERIAEQSRREGQEIAAGLHERIAELERDLADERKDIADAQLVLPACCGSLADAASTLKQERDELERELQRDLELMARTSLWRRLREQLDAVTAQRDELLHRARQTVWQGITCGKPYQLIPGEPLRAQLIVLGELCGAIEDARAQPEQPQQPKEEP